MAAAQLAEQDLEGVIDKKGVQCLNESKPGSVSHIFNGDPHLMVKSDADDQLLLSMPLTTMCKIRGIKITAPPGDTAPTRVRVFANRAEMGFDDVEDFPATQEWELTPEMMTEDAEPLQTKYVKFQKVTGLQFFFENEEGEVSAVSRIQLFGSAGDAVDVGGLKEAQKAAMGAE